MRISLYVVLFLFFFSSRRRHTRSLRDWSSDVCSSDLQAAAGSASAKPASAATGSPSAKPPAAAGSPAATGFQADWDSLVAAAKREGTRSEERRVGKECRSRRAPDHEKKKRKQTGINGS